MFDIYDKFIHVVDTLYDINFTQKIINPFGKLFKFAKRGQSIKAYNQLNISTLLTFTKLFEV